MRFSRVIHAAPVLRTGAKLMKLYVAIVATIALPSVGGAQERSSLGQEGHFNKLKPQLEQIFRFTFDGPRLKLERRGWGEPAPNANPNVAAFANAPPIEKIFTQIRTSAGGLTHSSMSVSNRHREVSFAGGALSGRVLTRGDYVRLELEEAAAPQRSLDWFDDGQGGMRLMLSHQDGDLILLQQTKQGAANIAGVVGGKAFSGSGASFLAMYKQHRPLLDDVVLPVFQSLSIRLMPSPQTTEMKKAVLALITRTPDVLAEGKKLMDALDSPSFSVRDKASRLLNERFEIYKDLIQERLKDAGTSQEAAARLGKILASHPEAEKVTQTIAALDLTRDPAYLITLLEEATADRPKVAAHLQAVTGQRLGEDPAAWKRWLQEKRP